MAEKNSIPPCLLNVIAINSSDDEHPLSESFITHHPINCYTPTTLKFTPLEEIFEFSVSDLQSDSFPKEPQKLFSKSKNFYILFDISHKCLLSEFLNEPTVTHTIDFIDSLGLDDNLAKLDDYEKDQLTKAEIHSNELILKYDINFLKRDSCRREKLIKNLLKIKGGLKILSTFIYKGLINEADLHAIKNS